MIEVADGQTVAEVRNPGRRRRHRRADGVLHGVGRSCRCHPVSIHRRWQPRDGARQRRKATSTDTTPPTVAKHRNVIVERSGSGRRGSSSHRPPATDDVDGALTSSATPARCRRCRRVGSQVSCTATDSAGNIGSDTFQMTVRKPTADGSAKALGGHGDSQCVAPNEYDVGHGRRLHTWHTTVTIQLQSSSLEVIRLQDESRPIERVACRGFVKIPRRRCRRRRRRGHGPCRRRRPGADAPLEGCPWPQSPPGGSLMALLRNKKCD